MKGCKKTQFLTIKFTKKNKLRTHLVKEEDQCRKFLDKMYIEITMVFRMTAKTNNFGISSRDKQKNTSSQKVDREF